MGCFVFGVGKRANHFWDEYSHGSEGMADRICRNLPATHARMD